MIVRQNNTKKLYFLLQIKNQAIHPIFQVKQKQFSIIIIPNMFPPMNQFQKKSTLSKQTDTQKTVMYSPFKNAHQIYLPKEQVNQTVPFNAFAGCCKNFQKLYISKPSQEQIKNMDYISTCYTNSIGYDYEINTFLDHENRVLFQIRSFQRYKKYLLKFLTPNIISFTSIGKKQQMTIKKIMKFNKHTCVERHKAFTGKFNEIDSDQIYQCWSFLSVYHQAKLDENFLGAFYGLSFLEIVTFFLIRSYAMNTLLFRLPCIEFHGQSKLLEQNTKKENQKQEVPTEQIKHTQQNDCNQLTEPQDSEKEEQQNKSVKENSQRQSSETTSKSKSLDKISQKKSKLKFGSQTQQNTNSSKTKTERSKCNDSIEQMEDISFDSSQIQQKHEGPQMKVTWGKDLNQINQVIRLSYTYTQQDYRFAVHNKTYWLNEDQELELQEYNPIQDIGINTDDPITVNSNIFDQHTEKQKTLLDWSYQLIQNVYKPKFKQMGIINFIRIPNMQFFIKPYGQFKRISKFKKIDNSIQKITMLGNGACFVEPSEQDKEVIQEKFTSKIYANSSSQQGYSDFPSQDMQSSGYDS